MNASTIVSILIPSFKRTETLRYLLQSIPSRRDIEVLVYSDNGPNWNSIESICKSLSGVTSFTLRYRNNPTTLGLDRNIHSLLCDSQSYYSLLMGDDDYFISESLNNLVDKLYSYRRKGINSILRSYITANSLTGSYERFAYYSEDVLLPCSTLSVAWVFKRSVSLAGVILHTPSAKSNYRPELTGSLLSHAYLAALAAFNSETLVLSEPCAIARDTWRQGDYHFGTSENEPDFHAGENISPRNSLAFLRKYITISSNLEESCPGAYKAISSDLSKYSYPFISVQRIPGIPCFLSYCKSVESLNFFNRHPYYYFYKYLLIAFGERLSSFLIFTVKRLIGNTPVL